MTALRYRAWRFLHPDLDFGEEGPGLRIAPTGSIDMVQEHASVRQAVLLLLTTLPGERVTRPEYGCDLHRLALSPNDDTTAGLAIYYVRRALERWEPRIQLLQVDAGRHPQDAFRLDVSVEYRVRATQRGDRLVYPLVLGGGAS
jgi:phage baseplate assembly protein W